MRSVKRKNSVSMEEIDLSSQNWINWLKSPLNKYKQVSGLEFIRTDKGCLEDFVNIAPI
jgi:hypothetical protein